MDKEYQTPNVIDMMFSAEKHKLNTMYDITKKMIESIDIPPASSYSRNIQTDIDLMQDSFEAQKSYSMKNVGLPRDATMNEQLANVYSAPRVSIELNPTEQAKKLQLEHNRKLAAIASEKQEANNMIYAKNLTVGLPKIRHRKSKSRNPS